MMNGTFFYDKAGILRGAFNTKFKAGTGKEKLRERRKLLLKKQNCLK
jgi:hypothetical protein